MHNEVWGCAEIFPIFHLSRENKPANVGDLKRRLMCMGDQCAIGKAKLWKFSCQKQTEAKKR